MPEVEIQPLSKLPTVIVGVPKETYRGESRVALVPGVVTNLIKSGYEVLVESSAGEKAGATDEQYTKAGAQVCSRDEVFSKADVILQVRFAGANADQCADDVSRCREKQYVIGMCDPLGEAATLKQYAEAKITSFAMELMPRITRAQSMDVLSSQATIAGYKAVLMAANQLPRMFPMMMTAAGTISPARVFVVGAGVAGLQAISTARRLGAVVHAYDVRPVVKEQVESLGAKFVEMELGAEESEQKGGYAKEMDEDFYRRQREMMTTVIAESDVVITTAAIPGRKSPILVTGAMVDGMKPGSIILDLASERGGNCEYTEANQIVEKNGVTIIGTTNIPSLVPFHASEMYSRNLVTFLKFLVKENRLEINLEDEVIRDTLVTYDGEIVNPKLRDILELPPLEQPEEEPELPTSLASPDENEGGSQSETYGLK